MSAPDLTFARADADIRLLPRMANRHGLIAGATGTGKTVTLRVLAERFSALGVPVFMADVKGDLSGLAQPAEGHPKVLERAQLLGVADGLEQACPVVFWDVFGRSGHPVRATISDMGPLLLSRLLGLNDVQSGLMELTFRVADDQGLLLLDLKDLRAMLQSVGDSARELRTRYGNVSAPSIGAIQRALLRLEGQGAEAFFGEPALELHDLMRTTADGRGVVNVLAADQLVQSPALYSTFLLWLLAELFENLPELGDPEKPRLVFFFDEAHLLFDDAPKALVDKVEQVVRLIRSKGVGVYFVTQNPLDLPDAVLGQLGNRVQHALRAFTPRDQKAVRAAAETFRSNPGVNVAEAITELGVGEALVSVLDAKGRPTPVERALIYPPASRLAPLTEAERRQITLGSPLAGRYDTAIDRESAYERLTQRTEAAAVAAEAPPPAAPVKAAPAPAPRRGRSAPAGGSALSGIAGAVARSAVRTIGSQIGRQIVRGLLGSIFGGSRR